MSNDLLSISGNWRFLPDVCGHGVDEGYHLGDHDDSAWASVRVPHSFDQDAPSLEFYQGHAWYRRSVSIPADWAGRRIVLASEGINYHADVYVNGIRVGGNQDGFLPFDLPLGEASQAGQENLIAIRVDNLPRPGDLPGPLVGWRPIGGILRELSLRAGDPCRVIGANIVAEPGKDGAGRFVVEVEAANDRFETVSATVEIVILDQTQAEYLRLSGDLPAMRTGDTANLVLNADVASARTWSPDDPSLYTARIAMRAGGETVDERSVRFGFRRIEAKGEQLLLNGRPVFLAGFNRHEDSPSVGMCSDLATARQDLEQMKRMGCNFIRLCHYPHHPGELDLCDELGLLAMCEIPMYWWDGLAAGEQACAEKLESGRRQLTRMIRRDRNHPSVIFWSVSNETREQRPEVAAGNAELVQLARKLDPTRLAVHVSHEGIWAVEPHNEQDDCLCINGYPSWWKGRYQSAGYDPDKARRFWVEHLEALHAAHPGRPILVTEFGHPCLDLPEGPASQGSQAEGIAAELEGMDHPAVCGLVAWCWADHPWPTDVGSHNHLTVSPYGLLTRDRRKREAFDVLARKFKELVRKPAAGRG